MHKVGNNLNLEELKHISGLDLTANGKNKKVEFQQHIELKEKLHDIINVDNCEKIFYWIVYTWGGVKENKCSSISQFVEDYKKTIGEKDGEKLLEKFASRQKRVASWSKILSFLYPLDYFIYDRRVAFTLDYLYGTIKYPVPSGFNTVVNAHVEGDRQPTLNEYKQYCSQIKELHLKLWPNGDENKKPYLTEMLIFALLENVGFCASIPENFKLEF